MGLGVDSLGDWGLLPFLSPLLPFVPTLLFVSKLYGVQPLYGLNIGSF